MITDKEKEIIVKCAKKYGIESVFLFGSATTHNEYNDIDIAIQGVKPGTFFDFYGELIRYMQKPIDLLDLSKQNPFNTIVLEEGLKIYG